MYDLDLSQLSSHETRVLKELSVFISTHQPAASLSAIDNIVLMYVIGVLDDLGNEDDFDVENFVEMIAAYVPGFESIEIAVVCEWIFGLSEQLQHREEGSDPSHLDTNTDHEAASLTTLPDRDDPSSLFQMQRSEGPTSFHPNRNSEVNDGENQECFDDVLSLDYLPKINSQTMTDCLLKCEYGTENNVQRHVGNNCHTHSFEASRKRRGQTPNMAQKSDLKKADVDTISDQGDLQQFEHSVTPRGENLKQTCKNAVGKANQGEGAFGKAEEQLRQVLDVIPGACSDEIEECLSLCRGDLDEAVTVLMERMALEDSRRDDDDKRAGISSKNGNQEVFKTKQRQSGRERRQRRKSRNVPVSGNNKDINNRAHKENVLPVDQADTSDPRKQVLKAISSSENERLLLELFPSASLVDARQCLSIAKGELDVASQLLMEKINAGEVQSKPAVTPLQQANKVMDDKKQREMLLQKYGFIDADEDIKEHKPFLPKPEKKKLVRYYDSKPVTVKGEKFFEIKDPT